jgi:hypothetical protein
MSEAAAAAAAAAPPTTDPPPPEAGGGFAKDDKIGASHHILNDSTASWDGDGTLLTEPSTPGSVSFPGGGRLEIDFIPSFAAAAAGDDDDGADAGAWAADFAKFADFGADVPGGPPVAAGLEAELGGGAAAGAGAAGGWLEWDGLPKEFEAEVGAELDEEDSWPESIVPANNQHQGTGNTKEKKPLWACCGTRRGKALVVGAVLVVVGGAVAAGVVANQ